MLGARGVETGTLVLMTMSISPSIETLTRSGCGWANRSGKTCIVSTGAILWIVTLWNVELEIALSLQALMRPNLQSSCLQLTKFPRSV